MSFSLVPGFAQRYPKEEGDDAALVSIWSGLSPESGTDGCVLIETCCTTIDQAVAAEARGAGRIELCVDLSVGGVTPPRELVREVVQALTIPVNVLIRPGSESPVTDGRPDGAFSAADFVYDEAALRQMVDDMAYCKTVGAAGIVVGALTPDGAIDRPAMRRLVAAAAPLPVTFHRAFDVCTADPFIALDQVIALGCARLLTSGMAATAWDGRRLIALLVRRAAARLIVIPGCGVTPDNLAALAAATRATEIHGTRIP